MGACQGFRIVELGSMVTGPLAGQILGDLGAEVIKIEPMGGEIMRGILPIRNGVSAAFAQWNRNKKSIMIDLKQAQGAALARRLIDSADAVIANFRPSVMETYGMDYKSVAERNPGVVYLAITGFGPDGPYSDQPAYDMVIQGLTGFMPTQGGPGGQPSPIRSAIADKVTAYSAALSVLAALLHREKGGPGQKIEISMLDAYAAFILPEAYYSRTFADAPEKSWTTNIYNLMQLKDGLAIGFIMTDQHLRAVCEAFGRKDLLADPRFSDAAQRNLFQTELIAELEIQGREMTRAELVKLAHLHQFPFSPVNDVDEFMEDPQALHNETFVEFYDERVGNVRMLNSFARFGKTPVQARSLPVEAGENTDEILTAAGLTPAEIQDLRTAKII